MNLSAEHIEGLAIETGFRPETLEKVIRLGEFAADIGRHPLLSRVLALKGGTALNLMFGSPARLSVDLDFNYVGQEARAGMQAERPEVEQAIVIIGEGQGYHVQQSRDAHAGRKIYLSYTSAAGTPDRIEIDLNFLFRIPLGEVTTRPPWIGRCHVIYSILSVCPDMGRICGPASACAGCMWRWRRHCRTHSTNTGKTGLNV